jgi:osmoprotectant transport system permease protein
VNFANQVLHWFLDGAHWQGDAGIPHRTFEHLAMSGASVAVAALIALPVGIAIGHYGRGGILAINISNIGRAVPSFAVLVIAVELFGIGALPAFIALVALAIPPMVTNSYIGMREVDADVREACCCESSCRSRYLSSWPGSARPPSTSLRQPRSPRSSRGAV